MQSQSIDRAIAIARSHGTAAASWAFNGNTPDDTYRRVLQGIADGDPEILDAYRAPFLSSEYDSDYTEADLADELGLDIDSQAGAADLDAAVAAYLDAADDEFWQETERIARDHLESAKVAALQSAGFRITYVDRTDAADGTVPPYGHYHHAEPAPGLAAYVDLRSVARGEDTADQTTTTHRSNYRSLIRDNADVFTPVSYMNVDVLGAFVADLTDELAATLTSLATGHPVYDEHDLSELESDEITESWDQYVRADVTGEVCDSPVVGDAWDALTEDEQHDLFWTVCDALAIYPEHDGREINWTVHYPAIVAEISGRLCAQHD
jgi:hypothetical protein